MSSHFTNRCALGVKRYGLGVNRRALMSALLLAAVGLGACTEVKVEETQVMLDTANCSGSGGFNNGGSRSNGGNQQPQISSAVMDTYIVQIFELYDPMNATGDSCNDCLAQRLNCFLEHETCICGDQTPVSAAALPGELDNLRVSLPTNNYGSLYCMRIMAVQRTSPAEEQCQCDSSWETVERTRLCAVSTPYAAGPLKVPMPVKCVDNQDFAACAVEVQSPAATASTN
jgi:hypothetical protein